MPPQKKPLQKEKSCPADQILNLQKVLSLNNILNSTLELNQLLTVIMKTSAEVMNAEVASLLLIDETSHELVFRVALGGKGSELEEKFRVKIGEGIAGTVAKTGEPLVINDAQNDPRFAKRFDASTGFVTRAILCVPLKAKDRIIGVLQAINPLRRQGFCLSDLDLFETFAHQAAIAIENAKLHSEIVKQEKAKQALKIAHEIQQNFLPDLKICRYGIDIDAQTIPAFDVGGDFYDVLQLGPDRIGIILGDVSGKGVPAALYMVRTMSEYRFLAPQCKDASELLCRLNEKLAQESCFGMFVTLMCLIIDKKQSLLQYASAGHHPILYRDGKTGQSSSLKEAAGVPLGLTGGMSFPQNTVPFKSGDSLFLYTDGVIEARNKKGQEYTIERLSHCIQEGAENAQAYSKKIFEDLNRFTTGAEQHDDITALAVVFIP